MSENIRNIVVQCCICLKYEVTGSKIDVDRVFKDLPEAVLLTMQPYDVSHTYCLPCEQQERVKYHLED